MTKHSIKMGNDFAASRRFAAVITATVPVEVVSSEGDRCLCSRPCLLSPQRGQTNETEGYQELCQYQPRPGMSTALHRWRGVPQVAAPSEADAAPRNAPRNSSRGSERNQAAVVPERGCSTGHCRYGSRMLFCLDQALHSATSSSNTADPGWLKKKI